MRTSRHRPTLSTTLAVTVAVTLLTAGPAAAKDNDTLLRDTFEGSTPPAAGGPAIVGVQPGGAPWVLADNSRVRVREDGRIKVVVKDLVIPPDALNSAPRNPVALMVASLVCDGMLVEGGTTEPFEVGTSGPELGDGRITDHITVPEDCDDPVVLIRNAGNPAGLGAYFAVATED